ALDRIGLNINGVERMINAAVGVTRADDTLPRRWFDEPITVGPYAGETIDRGEFDAMLSRFYAISRLGEDGQPVPEFRSELVSVLGG
ncbi:MAG TPA: aldehyde ferredoxin oxidoreductase C-terminal domain-containing protein, partial [Thermoanaerobaculia bacterium]